MALFRTTFPWRPLRILSESIAVNRFFRRYSAQVGAAVIVFIVTWIVLPTSEDSVTRLGQQDAYKFRVS